MMRSDKKSKKSHRHKRSRSPPRGPPCYYCDGVVDLDRVYVDDDLDPMCEPCAMHAKRRQKGAPTVFRAVSYVGDDDTDYESECSETGGSSGDEGRAEQKERHAWERQVTYGPRCLQCEGSGDRCTAYCDTMETPSDVCDIACPLEFHAICKSCMDDHDDRGEVSVYRLKKFEARTESEETQKKQKSAKREMADESKHHKEEESRPPTCTAAAAGDPSKIVGSRRMGEDAPDGTVVRRSVRVRCRGKAERLMTVTERIVGPMWRIADGSLVCTRLPDLPGEFVVAESFSVVSGRYKGTGACTLRSTRSGLRHDGDGLPCVRRELLEPVMSIDDAPTSVGLVRIAIDGGFPPYVVSMKMRRHGHECRSYPMSADQVESRAFFVPRDAMELDIRDSMKNVAIFICHHSDDSACRYRWSTFARRVMLLAEKFPATVRSVPVDEESAETAWKFPLNREEDDDSKARADELFPDEPQSIGTTDATLEAALSVDGPHDAPPAPQGTKTCSVCMDSEPNTILLPCRHMRTCEKCWDKIRDGEISGERPKCPTCRADVLETMKIFT